MNFLVFTMIFPFLGFVILVSFQRFLSKSFVSVIGVGSIALSMLVTFFVMMDFLNHSSITNGPFFFIQASFNWISIADFVIPVSFRLDGLSLSMLIMITLVSFLVHMYASWYMFDHTSYSLFFSYMNLFVANMILLILADNLLIMYFGWEGVGLCSYLLINFYHHNLKNGSAALKTLVMTRIGDVFLICAAFMLYNYFHTLDFYKLMLLSSSALSNISREGLYLITVCLLVASIAKSAQFPFQTWLSNAMVAPTPVSALIHAATMVTAGVYLIARTYFLFVMTPEVLYVMGIIGSVTLILSSCSALVQYDIKKILAYSTMGQISYMFIALAVHEKNAAIFHLIMHAFFKSLLFLTSGSLIYMCHGEQNIFKMGRLYKSMPFIYLSFLFGSASLVAIPLITSGFYSKGDILWKIFLSDNYLFTIVCFLGSFLTSLYTFRMIFIIFHGNSNIVTVGKNFNSYLHYFPLIILMMLSTVMGTWIKFPLNELFYIDFNENNFNKLYFEFFIGVLVVVSFCISSMYYLFSYCIRLFIDDFLDHIMGRLFLRYCFVGWGFDWMYEKIFIKPYLLISRLISFDPVNIVSDFIIYKVNFFSEKLVLGENGQLRYYVTSMIFGMIIVLLILIYLSL